LFQVTFMLANALGFVVLAPTLLLLLPTLHVFSVIITPIELLYFMLAVLYLLCALLIALIPAANLVESRPRKTTTRDLTVESLGVLQNVWQEMTQAWTFIRRRPRLLEAVIQLSFAGVLF